MIEFRAPLSFAQERIWFLQRLDPDDRSYQFQTKLTFDGALDRDALQRALDAIVARHEIFRTTYPSIDGAPFARVEAEARASLETIDLADFDRPGGAAQDAIERAVAGALARPFDVSHLPLVRWTLLRVAHDRHVLVHVEHHLVHDGWSFNVFLADLTALYRSYAAGSALVLGDVPSFTEYAARQREFAETPVARERLAYWREKLAGGPAFLNLPTDRQRPPVMTHVGGAIAGRLTPQTMRGVERLARERHATPFMVIFAAFCVMLARYSGEHDILVGTGAADRGAPELEGLIGMLVNTVVLRADLSGDPTFLDLLERIKIVAFEAYENEQVPLERIVEAIAPKRDRSYNPLFSVLFAFHDSREPELDFGPAVGAALDRTMDNASAKMDLNVVCMPRDGGMTLKWEYNSDLFDRGTMLRMYDHFRTLLDRIVDEPERRISRYDLMNDAERKLVLESFASNPVPYPRDRSIVSLFEEAVASTPNAPAILTDRGATSYGELDRRSNRLAKYLCGIGVEPGARVGLLFERGPEAVVAIVAILKAGAAYVPLDVRYPRERMAFVLDDANVAVTLTDAALADRLPVGANALRIDERADEIARTSDAALASAGDANVLAYVMYTSGSTGLPKGVRVMQRGIVRLVCSGEPLQFRSNDTVLHYSSTAFDGSTLEIWGALLAGAALAIPPPGLLSLADLARSFADLGVTVATLTTPLFHQLVESRLDELARLRLVFSGGDVLSPAHARRLAERGGPQAFNGYGPTENTTYSTLMEIDDASTSRRSVPIGRPIANTSIAILDEHEKPCAIGVPGEICTSGDGVADGYLNRPELTAERFGSDAFSDEPGARSYRTGDIGRWLADGTIEFFGRRDSQVKIRGFRVEIGAIESTIRAHALVNDVAVVLDGPAGERTLVAHVAIVRPGAIDARALRAYVAERLPEYEVPSRIVLYDALPTSIGLKVDRTALRGDAPAGAADFGAIEPVREYDPPRGDFETRLAAIWQHVLDRPQISRGDDFFDLGGHSLMAMRVLARITDAFAIDLSLRDLFEYRTLETLAHAIERAPRIEPRVELDLASLSDAEIDALLADDDAKAASELDRA